ncbi:kinase-like domain-containing protein [Haematococcus lacustris]
MVLPTHLVLVVDISGSMRKCDVRCDANDDEDDEDGDYFSAGPSSSFQRRANAVFGCCADMVRQQMRDGATGRDRCTMVLFNDAADTVLQERRFKKNLLQEIEWLKDKTRPCDRTEYRVGLAGALQWCVSRAPKAHTVVFLSDGAPGDVHFNSSTEGLLYDLLDSFSLSCAPGTFTLHTIGFGPDSSNFIWLRKMAAAVGGVYHQPKQSGGRLSTAALRRTFRDISSSVTKLRSSSGLSGLTSTMAVASLKPDQGEDGGPPRTEVLLGDLLTWDAVTGQHEVTMRGVRLELHHPHFARGGSRVAYRAKWLTPLPQLAPDGSRPSDVELAPAGSQPQTCLMKPGQVVIAKWHRHRKDQHVYDAKCLETAKACAASFPGPPVTFIDCQLFRCIDKGQLRYLSVEEELAGPYCKHNGNNGYVAPRSDAFERQRSVLQAQWQQSAATFELAQAFSHWSWVHSSRQYLVCDIQGVGGRWTDAQVNSQARVYGQADMGSQGITKFFESHRCHQACRNLRLSRFWPIED